MYPLFKIILMTLPLCVAAVPAYPQLRMHSPYYYDRIDRDESWFVLYETGSARYAWASEWTQDAAHAFPDHSAFFVWHFKDGTPAYSRQGEYVGDFGRLIGYDINENSPELNDRNQRPVQPMTRDNYPVRLELWIGKVSENAGLDPHMLVDRVCFETGGIDYGKQYFFSDCPAEAGRW